MRQPELESTKYDGTPVPVRPSWWLRPLDRQTAVLHAFIAFSMVFAAAFFVAKGLSWYLLFAPSAAALIAWRWRRAMDTPVWIYGMALFVGAFMSGVVWLRTA